MYPDHPDFDYSREIQSLVAERNKDWARQPWVAMVASAAWKDDAQLNEYVDGLAAKYPQARVITPDRATGAAKRLDDRLAFHGYTPIRVKSEGTWGNARQAVQAQQIIYLADVINVFFAGGTDLPKALIDKALLTHRPDHRFGSGLHVYEMTKTRATKSSKSHHTGRVKYRTRKEFGLIERKAA